MTDYNIYEMNHMDYIVFFIGGYGILFALGYIFYKSIILSIAFGFMIFFFRSTYVNYMIKKRKEKLLLSFKNLLYSLSASIQSGRSMQEGLKTGYEELCDIYEEDDDIMIELKAIVDGIYENRSNEAALLNDFAKRSDVEDILNFTDVYNAVRNTGGDVEKVIERTSTIIMDKINIDKEIKTVVSQKKLEAGIIAAMPIAVITGMNITASSYLEPMYETFSGRLVMTVSLAAILVSYVLIIKITDIRV